MKQQQQKLWITKCHSWTLYNHMRLGRGGGQIRLNFQRQWWTTHLLRQLATKLLGVLCCGVVTVHADRLTRTTRCERDDTFITSKWRSLRVANAHFFFVVSQRLLENSDIFDQLYDSMPHWWWWLTSFSFFPINLWIIYIYALRHEPRHAVGIGRSIFEKKKEKRKADPTQEKTKKKTKKKSWIDNFGFIFIPFGCKKGPKTKKKSR